MQPGIVLDRVRDEVESGVPAPRPLLGLPQLGGVLLEVLRLHPPAPVIFCTGSGSPVGTAVQVVPPSIERDSSPRAPAANSAGPTSCR